MNIKKVQAVIDEISFYELSDDEQDKIKMYAAYVVLSDPIGRDLIKSYLARKNKRFIFNFLFLSYILYYMIFIFFPPILSNFTESIEYLSLSAALTGGASTYLIHTKWYWIIVFNFVTVIVSFIIFAVLQNSLPSRYRSKNGIRNYVSELLDKGIISREAALISGKKKVETTQSNSDKSISLSPKSETEIFIVHGHDSYVKIEVARFIEKLGLDAVILHEKSSGKKTLIEKIEAFTNVAFAIILLTPDDKGCELKNSSQLNQRARQNVIFEHGYLMSKLGHDRVCALVKGEVEVPSDLGGIIYIPFDKAGAQKMEIAKEMKLVNIGLDMSDAFQNLITDRSTQTFTAQKAAP